MLITHVIPAYNASATIIQTLESVFRWPLPAGWQVEAVVVDDGSADSSKLGEVVSQYSGARLVVHEVNRGMCAGRNSGIAASKGAIVTILDSDDELVANWPVVMEKIIQEWPGEANICYAACQNPEGRLTVQEPDYQGYLTVSDLLNEFHSGEYIPLFRGDYVRGKPYVDLGMRKSCGIVSYLNFALDGPFWITNRVLRIYNEARTGSISHDWTSPTKSAETARCYQALLARYGSLYQLEAPEAYRTKLLKLAVYMKLAGIKGYFDIFAAGASLTGARETFGSLILLIAPVKLTVFILGALKSNGIVRRYG